LGFPLSAGVTPALSGLSGSVVAAERIADIWTS
jgi:hypothetical protein